MFEFPSTRASLAEEVSNTTKSIGTSSSNADLHERMIAQGSQAPMLTDSLAGVPSSSTSLPYEPSIVPTGPPQMDDGLVADDETEMPEAIWKDLVVKVCT